MINFVSVGLYHGNVGVGFGVGLKEWMALGCGGC